VGTVPDVSDPDALPSKDEPMNAVLRRFLWLTATSQLLFCGCIPVIPGGNGNTDTEPDNTPSTARPIKLSSTGHALILGSIRTSKDVDVFDVGAVEAGDRIVVHLKATSGSSLDPLVGLFNADVELIDYNDDVDYIGGDYDSRVDHVVRHATNHLYIGVTDSGFGASSGGYSLDIQVTGGGSVPATRSQVVILDFDGAVVPIPGDRTYTITAFNAGSVDPRLNGKEAEVEQGILNVMNERYAAYNIDFFLEGDPNIPSDVAYSSLVFGGRNPSIFGIAQAVDHYNQNPSDRAIVFTDQWTNPFSYTPTVNAIVESLGNVGAHELGHLLGLEHTADVTELMDSTGTPDTILVPQDVKTAPLYEQVFPFGWQDAVQLLLDTLGPAPAAP